MTSFGPNTQFLHKEDVEDVETRSQRKFTAQAFGIITYLLFSMRSSLRKWNYFLFFCLSKETKSFIECYKCTFKQPQLAIAFKAYQLLFSHKLSKASLKGFLSFFMQLTKEKSFYYTWIILLRLPSPINLEHSFTSPFN